MSNRRRVKLLRKLERAALGEARLRAEVRLAEAAERAGFQGLVEAVFRRELVAAAEAAVRDQAEG